MAAKFPLQAAYQVGISAKLPVELAAKALTQPWLTMKIFQPGSYLSKAPEHYKKFYWDWKRAPRTPVHYIPETANWKKLPTGEVQQVEDLPIPLMEPKSCIKGYGWRGCHQGFVKEKRLYVVLLDFGFLPSSLQSFIQKILDKHINVVVTKRTLRLVDEHYGFDNYILKQAEIEV
ncbi:large ribosomal subunit protein bL28m-like [Macrobrachium nipponense]|uniref:large ribosomal subunit protein bL28m-like n=1 Tax=Macrobrachium nipponense TaxID=159736 RepID=UPI0030C7AC25